jgi:hypothetical protein
MKRYKFILKPLFFIFSLTASSYMVLVIEKISPSDFGRQHNLFVADPPPIVQPVKSQARILNYSHQYLRNLCFDYKFGIIDNETLDERINTFLYGFGSQKISPPQIASANKNNTILLQRIAE